MRVSYPKAANGAQLYGELIAAIPALAPLPGPEVIPGVASSISRFTIEEDGGYTVLTLPDEGLDMGAVADVVHAHIPAEPPPPPPDTMTQILAAIDAAATLDDFLKLVKERLAEVPDPAPTEGIPSDSA